MTIDLTPAMIGYSFSDDIDLDDLSKGNMCRFLATFLHMCHRDGAPNLRFTRDESPDRRVVDISYVKDGIEYSFCGITYEFFQLLQETVSDHARHVNPVAYAVAQCIVVPTRIIMASDRELLFEFRENE